MAIRDFTLKFSKFACEMCDNFQYLRVSTALGSSYVEGSSLATSSGAGRAPTKMFRLAMEVYVRLVGGGATAAFHITVVTPTGPLRRPLSASSTINCPGTRV